MRDGAPTNAPVGDDGSTGGALCATCAEIVAKVRVVGLGSGLIAVPLEEIHSSLP